MAYVTRAEVRKYQAVKDISDDALLDDLITRAQAIIDAYTRTTFEASGDTNKTFDAVEDVEGMVLHLRNNWLASVNTITNGDGSSVDTATVILEPVDGPPYNRIRIRSDQSYWWTYSTYHEGAITVNGEWAYSATAPDDIKHAMLRLIHFLYKQRDNATDLEGPILTPTGTILLPAELPRDIRLMLEPYVMVV